MKPTVPSPQKWPISAAKFCLVGYVGGMAGFWLPSLYRYGAPPAHENPTAVLISSAAFLAGLVLNIILHELAHALAAHALDGVIYGIEIGSGQLLFQFWLGSWPWAFRRLLLNGVVLWGPTSDHRLRLQHALVIGAGPAATLLTFLCSLFILQKLCPAGKGIDPNAPLAFILGGWFAALIWLLFEISVPFTYHRDGQKLHNDSLSLLLLLLGRNTDALHEAVPVHRAFKALSKSGEPRLPDLKTALSYTTDHPHDVHALVVTADYLDMADDPRAFDYARRAWDALPADSSREFCFALLDRTATLGLNSGRLSEWPEVEPLLQEMVLASTPYDLGARGTYGSALIDFGKTTEGIGILNKVTAKSHIPMNRAYSHLFLALGYERLGHEEEARQHAILAASAYPDCKALPRISHLLPASSEGESFSLPVKTSGSI